MFKIHLFARLRSLLRRVSPRVVSRFTAVSLATASAGALEAQSAPRRPAGAVPGDTIHRYGEKFVLSRSDSVVIRADTVWYPRKGASPPAAVPDAPNTSRSDTSTRRPPASSSGGGHQSHVSHASHSSHRSMVGYRRGY
jgi:hypothetical protein